MKRKQEWKELTNEEKDQVIIYFNLLVDRRKGSRIAQRYINSLSNAFIDIDFDRLCDEISRDDNYCVAFENHGYAYRLDVNPSFPIE